MTRTRKCPGSALQRTTGAGEETDRQLDFQVHVYATCGELQSRHIRMRYGLKTHRSRLIAALCFGEVSR